jgi:hypothetical protein
MRLAALCLLLPGLAWSHARLTTPEPRTINTNLKSAPCGVARSAEQKTTAFTAGERATVTFAETVPHPGHYVVRFSPAGESNFTVLADNLPNPDGQQLVNTVEVTIPSTPCTDCVIQLEQFMSESNTSYFSCANISVAAAPSNNTETSKPDQKPLTAPETTLSGAGCAATGLGFGGAMALLIALGSLPRWPRRRWEQS